MSIRSVVSNEVAEDASGVWILAGHEKFGYSDGAESEAYLERAFRESKDLTSGSAELESWIKDWPSEYHLTSRRAQLLSGFEFNRSMKVLEVGCGCGAITRFLGETFDDVVSVEGSISRARLARLRTRDLPHVTVISAPFQAMKFARKFDIVFCIGVYEYSRSFVDDADPYDSVLAYFRELLNPGGILVLAIENQFGLKYFSGLSEDHLGTAYSGIEGYHTEPNKVRTFGRVELERNILRHFAAVRFFYPYPDYKIPSCVVDEEFLKSGGMGELVAGRGARDYSRPNMPAWAMTDATLELARNDALPFFSNSFLVVAGKAGGDGVSFPQRAVAANTSRRPEFRTVTRVVDHAGGAPRVVKSIADGSKERTIGKLTLLATTSDWSRRISLDLQCYLLSRNRRMSLAQIVAPAAPWVELLRSTAIDRGGRLYLPGDLLDATWQNVFPGGDQMQLVDQEWKWEEDIPVSVLVIRSIFYFILNCEERGAISSALNASSGRQVITAAAESLGVQLHQNDFQEFIALESAVQSIVSGTDALQHDRALRWFLSSRRALRWARGIRALGMRVRGSLEARTGISLGARK